MPQNRLTQSAATTADAEQDAPFEKVWFNNAINRGIQYIMPGAGWIGKGQDGTDKFDPALAHYIRFSDGRYEAQTAEEADFLRKAENVHEGKKGYNKPCRVCGRVWQSEDARDDCLSLHAR